MPPASWLAGGGDADSGEAGGGADVAPGPGECIAQPAHRSRRIVRRIECVNTSGIVTEVELHVCVVTASSPELLQEVPYRGHRSRHGGGRPHAELPVGIHGSHPAPNDIYRAAALHARRIRLSQRGESSPQGHQGIANHVRCAGRLRQRARSSAVHQRANQRPSPRARGLPAAVSSASDRCWNCTFLPLHRRVSHFPQLAPALLRQIPLVLEFVVRYHPRRWLTAAR